MGEIKAPRLRVLGIPTWVGAHADIVFLAERPYQLLALLACRGVWMTRDELAEFMWPDRSQAVARGNLRTLLLRSLNLSPEFVIEQQADRLRWRPDSDLLQLELAFAEGRFADVMALYHGPLLQGMEPGLAADAVDWLHFERDRIASLWRVAAGHELQAHATDPVRVAALAESILAADPGDEAAVAMLARARAAQDRSADGVRILRSHAAWLAANFAIEPSARLRELELELSQAATFTAAAAGPAARPASKEAMPNRLVDSIRPGAVSLVGRRLELLQIHELMQMPECRVLTLTGLGGVGKSALARAALTLLAPQFSDGVCWVALDDLTHVAEIPDRIAHSLGLTLQGAGEDAWHDIQQRLEAQSMLLAFDNSEHLPDLAPHLGHLLDTCAALRVLNTSRTRVGAPGEWLLPIEGLPVPDDDETDLQLLRRCDSVRLFESRALAVRPSFDLRAEAADVIGLVRAVEGLPLAIELSAAWVRLMPVRAIVDELARSLDLLDQGTMSGRDRGLRASFDHSWRMLGPAERGALARLGLLPAAFERGMASQVAGCGLPLLAALVDRSLVQADGSDRYTLHPLLRQCAAEKAMAGACDLATQRMRHLSFVTHWLARISLLGGGRQADEETRQAWPHIRSAWQWALEQREPGIVQAGANRLAQFCGGHGLLAEGRDALQRACSAFVDGDALARRAAGRAAVAEASLWQRSGGFARAQQLGQLAVELGDPVGDTELQVMGLNAQGVAIGYAGQNEPSVPLLQRALAIARLRGHDGLAGIVLGNLARALKALGRYDEAAGMMGEALANARAAQPPNHDGVVLQTNNLGNLHGATGRWDVALPLFEQALGECEARGATLYRPLVVMNLARASLALGRIDDARRHALAALEMATAQGRDVYAMHLHLVLVRVALAQIDLSGARSALLDALRLADRLKLAAEWVRCVAAYAELLMFSGDVGGAIGLWRWVVGQPGLAADDAEDAERRLKAAEGAAPGDPLDPRDLVPPLSALDGSPAAVAAWVTTRCASPSARSVDPPGMA